MRKRQKYTSEEARQPQHLHSRKHSQILDVFLQNYMNCHMLYHMNVLPQSKAGTQNHESQLIKHVFVNAHQFQDLPKPLSMENTNAKLSSNKSLFDTFSRTNLTQDKEEQQYSNYLKQYQTLMKFSRKQQQLSPQKQNKQMNLLINQFLSDLHEPSQSSQSSRRTIKTPPKLANNTVKVEKIDLNTFQIDKFSAKSKETKLQDRRKSTSKDKVQKQVTPRFININERKANSKKNQIIERGENRSKQKIQIQVIKIKDFRVKTEKQTPKNKLQKITIAKNVQKFNQASIQLERPQQTSRKEQRLNQTVLEQGYSKNRQVKQSRLKQISSRGEKLYKKEGQSDKKEGEPDKNTRKPIKIQIQLPLEQENQIQESKQPTNSNVVNLELESQREKIIKDISHKVLSLLQKSKNFASKGK